MNWLKNELKAQGIKKEAEVYLGILDKSGNLSVFKNNDDMQDNDVFE